MRLLRALHASDVRVAMLTGVSDEMRHAEFLEGGAVAVISKSSGVSDVLAMIDTVLAGVDPHGITRRAELQQMLRAHRYQMAKSERVLGALTDRERATMQALVDGLHVDDIARQRTVAPSTVRTQVRAVLRKFETNSQIRAISIAVRNGMHPSAPAESL